MSVIKESHIKVGIQVQEQRNEKTKNKKMKKEVKNVRIYEKEEDSKKS